MAIPFNLPSDQQTEDNYRLLDQLLEDLYRVLRQILLRPRCLAEYLPTGNDEEPDDSGLPAPHADVTGSRRVDLPDVVYSALSAPCHCTSRRRRQRRRRRASSCCSGEADSLAGVRRQRLDCSPAAADSWLIVGEQLKKIAEEIRSTFRKQEVTREKEEQQNLRVEVKSSSLFSLLVPSHFRSSLWTTVILLVGWRLLARTR